VLLGSKASTDKGAVVLGWLAAAILRELLASRRPLSCQELYDRIYDGEHLNMTPQRLHPTMTKLNSRLRTIGVELYNVNAFGTKGSGRLPGRYTLRRLI